MARSKGTNHRGSASPGGAPAPTAPAAGVLERLTPEEARSTLRLLLEKQPALRAEAEGLAAELVAAPDADDIADQVFDAVSSVDLDALNSRAGAHAWGYVEPSEAATELLGESLEDLIGDMKRRAELGLTVAAEAMCAGMVDGLYRARDIKSDGALGWSPDFPVEEAGHAVAELMRSCPPAEKQAARVRVVEAMRARAPEWASMLQREAHQAAD